MTGWSQQEEENDTEWGPGEGTSQKALMGLPLDKAKGQRKQAFTPHSGLVTDDLRLTLQKGKLRPGEIKCLGWGHTSWQAACSQTQVLSDYDKVTSCNS